MKTVHEAVQVILDELKSTLSESSFISERRDYLQLLKMADERKAIFPTQELFDAFAADDHGHRSRRKKHAMVLKRLDKEADMHALRPDLRPYNKIPLPSKEETEAVFSEVTFPVPPSLDIGYLIVRANAELYKLNHKPHSIDDDYMGSMHTIHWFFISHGQNAFNFSLLNEFLLRNDELYASGKIHRNRWYNDRKAVYILEEIALTGNYSWKYISSSRFMEIDSSLEPLRQNFIKHLHSNNLSEDTVKNYDLAFKCVICFSGISSLERLSAFSAEDIQSITHTLAERYDRSCLRSMYGRIQKVLQFLYDNGITSHNWAGSLVSPAVLQRHVAGYFSDEAEASLYACLDAVSLRDRAICLLAADLGLRDYDICHLRFEQIDWQGNKLCIVQHKNDVPLVLPLIAEVGNALMDYILNERPRPEPKNPYVFLTSVAPYRRLEHAYRPCRNLIEISGAEPVQGKHKGSHLYRDNLVHRMLKNKVTHQVITDSLGHRSKESDKSYITMEPEMLRQCALGLDLIGPHCWKEGGLLG